MRICHWLSMEVPALKTARAISSAQLYACKHLIDTTPEHEHTVLLFGNQDFEDHAASVGVDTTDRIGCPSNDPARAGIALERYLQHRPLFDSITCWSERTLMLWEQAAWMNLDAVGVMLGSPAQARRLNATPIVTLDQHDAEAWRETGADAQLAAPCRQASAPSDDQRRQWRQMLGASEDELVLGLIADLAPNADSLWLCTIQTVLEHAGVRSIGLAPTRASGWNRAKRVHRNMAMRSPIIRLDGPMLETISMCDLALLKASSANDKRGAETLLIELVQSMGVPVLGGPAIAERVHTSPLVREHCIGRNTMPTIMAGKVSGFERSRMLARRLRTGLIERPPLETPSLTDTLSSIWAHAARRRPMIANA